MINKTEFTNYLKSKHHKSKSGKVNSPDGCPAARFISQKYYNVQVNKDGITGENKETNNIEVFQPQEWLINFITEVDNGEKVVTYGRCLKIMETV